MPAPETAGEEARNPHVQDCPDCGRPDLHEMDDRSWVCHSCGYVRFCEPARTQPDKRRLLILLLGTSAALLAAELLLGAGALLGFGLGAAFVLAADSIARRAG